MKKLWPSWRYRRGADGGIESRVFKGPDEITGDGWKDSPALIDVSEDASAPEAEISAIEPSKEHDHGEEASEGAEDRGPEPEESEGEEAGQGTGEGQVLNFDGLSKEAIIDIADKAGVKIDRRWSRARIIDALKEA